jgi:paraquat-inducible protein B
MSKKANPTIIGVFFASGLALGVAGLLAFSARSHFHPQVKYVLYFDGSLKGLNPGAPVRFRGVTVGSVVDVRIRHNQAANDHSMPVIISVDKELTQSKSDEELQFTREKNKELIGEGYRGRLEAESLVTGILYVELDIIPNAPPPVFHQTKPEYNEIPTMPSQVQQLLENLAHFDLPGLSDKLNALLSRLDATITQLNVSEINASATNLLSSLNQLVKSEDLTNSLASLRLTLNDARNLIQRVDRRVDPLADGATNMLYDARKTLADLRVTIQSVASLLGPDSPFPPDLKQTLQDLSNAGRAITDLAEFLERNPDALLTGRKKEPK